MQGASPEAGIPTIKTINGLPLAATSSNPSYATNNVETVVSQGAKVQLGGSGFDLVNGVAIDLFCACPGGKVGPFFLNPGDLGRRASLLTFTLPAVGLPNSPLTGPGSFVASNAANLEGLYQKKQRGLRSDRSSNLSLFGQPVGIDRYRRRKRLLRADSNQSVQPLSSEASWKNLGGFGARW